MMDIFKYNLNDFMPLWDIRVAIDQFLGALGAGAFLAAIYVSHYHKRESKIGAFIAPVAAALGLLLVMTELGKPFRAIYAVLGNPTSILNWGTWIQGIFIPVAFLYAITITVGGKERLAKTLGIVGAFVAVLVASYHGLLMSVIPARPIWNSAHIPPLSLIYALTTGIAAYLILLSIVEKRDPDAEDTKKSLTHIWIWLLFAQLVMGVAFMLNSYWAGSDVLRQFKIVVGSPIFWVGVVILGMILPILILLSKKPVSLILTASLVLIGGLAFRYVLLDAGFASIVYNISVDFFP